MQYQSYWNVQHSRYSDQEQGKKMCDVPGINCSLNVYIIIKKGIYIINGTF